MNGKFLPESETTEFEDRLYLNPNVSLQEQNAFIDNLRNVQNANNAEVNAQTYNLGTSVPSNLGGLVGGEGYFANRYQVPQNTNLVANLRATAQAQALNETLGNELAMWKQRYNRAKRDYDRRNNGGGNPDTNLPITGGVDEETIDSEQFDVRQDMNNYGYDTDIYDSTKVQSDNRSFERNKNISVVRNNDGSIRTITINGVKYSGREGNAKYRQLKRDGLVR